MTAGFTEAAARHVLTLACPAIGISDAGAELVRLGENAIFRLVERPMIVRIGRGPGKLPIAVTELRVARWLHRSGVRVTRPCGGIDQPLVLNGHPVSVWHLVTGGKRQPGVVDLAKLLRAAHALQDSPFELPEWDPIGVAKRRLETVVGVSDADRSFLLERCQALRDGVRGLSWALSIGYIHGDAHTGNLLGASNGAVLTDFECAAMGPREWDLVPVAMARDHFGLAEIEYGRFVGAYGFDVTQWPGYPVLRAVREVYTTAWLLQNLAESPAVEREAALRIASIRDGDTNREWHSF